MAGTLKFNPRHMKRSKADDFNLANVQYSLFQHQDFGVRLYLCEGAADIQNGFLFNPCTNDCSKLTNFFLEQCFSMPEKQGWGS